MRRGEQQKILHKGFNDKVNVFITLLYPLNGIKFKTSKTRNSNDFINHLNSIKRYVHKEKYQEIHTCNRQCIISCQQKDKTVYRKTIEDWLTVLFLPTRAPFLNIVETKVNRNLKKDICANYNYETEYNLLCTVRRYLRCIGSWPKI